LRIRLLAVDEVIATDLVIKQKIQSIAGGVGYRDHDIRVHHIVNERNVLVPDTLDVVLAIAVVEHRWAFKRFDSRDPGAVQFLEPIASRDGAGRSGRRDKSRQAVIFVGALEMLEHRVERGSRAVVMNEVVRKFGELVDDHVLAVLFQFSALVVDFLDVALGARRANNVRRIGYPMLQPIEPLAAHACRQHRSAAAAQNA
jgi:hypothetical protein